MLREENEMTQAEIANIFCVEPQTVSKWETGLSFPDIHLISKLADFYRISMDDFLNCNIAIERFTLKRRKEKLAEAETALFDAYRNRQFTKLVKILNQNESCNTTDFLNLDGQLWIYDNNELVFINPQAELPYKNKFMRDIIIFAGVWPKYTPFMIKNFMLPYEMKTIEKLFELQVLKKLMISYLGPINELYPDEACNYPELVGIPYLTHPDIDLLRQYCIDHTGKDIFDFSDANLISKLNLTLRVGRRVVRNGLSYYENFKTFDFIEQVIGKLNYSDAFESLEEIISWITKLKFNPTEENKYLEIKDLVKKTIFKYLENEVVSNKKDTIIAYKNLFETYFSLEEFSKIIYEHASMDLYSFLLEEIEVPILDNNLIEKYINDGFVNLSTLLASLGKITIALNSNMKKEIENLRKKIDDFEGSY